MLVINRGKYAQGLRQKSAINGDILFPLQGQQNVIAFKRLTDSLRFGMGVTNALHIGDDDEQKIVALIHRLGNRLNTAFLGLFH